MNFLCHARHHLDAPYAALGTGLPDLVGLANRKNRLKPGLLPAAAPGTTGALLTGAHAHFHDDLHFHKSEAFRALNAQFTALIRARAPDSRASVLGHILVEIVLDRVYMDRHPGVARRYERALSHVSPEVVGHTVNRWLPRPSVRLPRVVAGFRRARFWNAYRYDEGIEIRLGQVARRVGLGEVPGLVDVMPQLRRDVAERADELLSIPPP